jgi:hypothetical protein
MFKVGEEIEVWSKAKLRWMPGCVEAVADDNEAIGVRGLIEGSVKAKIGGSNKWISPVDFDQIRHAVVWEAPCHPEAPPPSCLRAIRKHYFSDPAEVRKGVRICAQDLQRLWFRAVEEDALAESALGFRRDKISIREAETTVAKEWNVIHDKVKESFIDLDVQWFLGDDDPSGSVDVCEWLHRALMLRHPPGPIMDRAIREALGHRERGFLWKLISRWMYIDKQGNGVLTRKELTDSLFELRCNLSPRESDKLAMRMLHNIDAHELGQASYSEFVATCLKIAYSEVALYWYDLSNDWAKYLSPLLLGSSETGIWHTGIVAFGREYFFGGRTTWQTPGATIFGRPSKFQRLGLTTKSLDNLRDHLFVELDRKFDRRSYDVLEHNCNHFADEVAYFLLGRGIPDEVRLQPKRVMNAPVAKIFRPLLNHWLGRVEAGREESKNGKERRPSERFVSRGGA